MKNLIIAGVLVLVVFSLGCTALQLQGSVKTINGNLYFNDIKVVNYSMVYANNGVSFYYLDMENKITITYYVSRGTVKECAVSLNATTIKDSDCLRSVDILAKTCVYKGTLEAEQTVSCM